jgi:hypothetical protein
VSASGSSRFQTSAGQDRERVGLHDELAMFRAQVARHLPGEHGLVLRAPRRSRW